MMKKLTVSVLVFALAISACVKKQTETSIPQVTTANEQPEAVVTQLVIGTAGLPPPYGWINPDGTLDGYDSAVIKAVDEALPQYSFKVEITEFPSIFVGIDAGRYKIGVNNISWRKDREEKYLFAKNHYIYNNTGILVQKGRTDIRGVDDLGGKTDLASADGAFPQLFVEEYNEAHPDNPILITYSEEDALKTWTRIINGTLDFVLSEEVSVELRKKEFGLDVDFISLPKEEQEKIQNPKSYWIFPRTAEGEGIREAVDGAFEKLIADGTLSKLAVQYFGSDISQ
jgi:ABC-type amino acid transport substrate-binding protein